MTDGDGVRLERAQTPRTAKPGRHLLHRIHGFGSSIASTAFLLGVASGRLAGGHCIAFVIGATAINVFAVCESLRSIAVNFRARDRRETELTNAARRDGVSLATTTLQHHIGNKLAVTVGYGEMLLDDPRLPPELKGQVQKVLSSAMDAVAIVRKLDIPLARIELDRGLTGPKVLDVDASIRIDA